LEVGTNEAFLFYYYFSFQSMDFVQFTMYKAQYQKEQITG